MSCKAKIYSFPSYTQTSFCHLSCLAIWQDGIRYRMAADTVILQFKMTEYNWNRIATNHYYQSYQNLTINKSIICYDYKVPIATFITILHFCNPSSPKEIKPPYLLLTILDQLPFQYTINRIIT